MNSNQCLKRRLWRTCHLFVALVTSAATAVAVEWDTREIVLEPKSGADVALATYGFTNASANSVQMQGISTDCGCTDAQVNASAIAPHQRGYIQVVFTIGHRSGIQQKEILVRSSDSPTPVKLRLIVKLPAQTGQPHP